MKHKFIFTGVFAACASIALLFTSCAGGKLTENERLTISAAISLKHPLDEIAAEFSGENGVEIDLNYGASGTLQKQIESGAPVDIFISAGERQAAELERGGFLLENSRAIIAENTLVVIAPKNSIFQVSVPADLSNENLKRIAIGNPKTVPAGEYAVETLKNSGILESVMPKMIFAENVRQVVDYVARGETDAGIVYATDAVDADVKIIAKIDGSFHSKIIYPFAIVKRSENRTAAERFSKFILSEKAKAILQKHGFVTGASK